MPDIAKYLIFAGYFILTLLLIYRASFFRATGIKPLILVSLFILKLICGLSLNHYYKNRYENGNEADIYKYFNDGKALNTISKENPRAFLKIFFSADKNNSEINKYSSEMENWAVMTEKYKEVVGLQKTGIFETQRTLIRINALLYFISAGFLPTHTLIFSFISFIGLCFLFRALKPYFRSREIIASVFIFIIPSSLIWTSTLLKESLIVFSLGCFTYAISNAHNIKKTHYLLLAFALFLLLTVSQHITIILLFSALTWWILTKPGVFRIVLPLVVLAGLILVINFSEVNVLGKISAKFNNERQIGMGGHYFKSVSSGEYIFIPAEKMQKKNPGFSKEKTISDDSIKLPVSLTNFANPKEESSNINIDSESGDWFLYLFSYDGASTYLDVPQMDHTLKGMLIFLPHALKNVFIQPLQWRKGLFPAILFFAENILVLILTGLSFYVIFTQKINTTHSEIPVIFYFLVFSLLLYILIGYTSPIAGNIIRHKAPAVIFFLLALSILNKTNTSSSFIRKTSNLILTTTPNKKNSKQT